MAAGTSLRVTLRGLGRFKNALDRYARVLGGRAPLHQRYGIQALRWVDKNFQSQGGLLSTGAWRKLSPNTILGRRRRSSKILQDTGQMRASFNMRFNSREARVGSPSPQALIHERGTKKGYMIFPKNKKFLAFPHTRGKPLGRATFFPSKERKFPAGTPIVFSKGVRHPGIAQRRMLPRRIEILPILVRTTENFLREARRKAGV